MSAILFAVNTYSSSSREQEPPEQPALGNRFTIRTLRQQDISELSTILAESFHLQANFMRWLIPVMRMGIYEDLRNRLRSAPTYYVCMVAIADEQSNEPEFLAGTIELTLRSTSAWSICQPRYPYLSNLAVRAECRRQGIARQLLSACERVVLEWGFQDIYLHVLESNYQARQLYLKAGYQVQDTDSSWSYWLFRQPRRLFLHKRLVQLEPTH
jgi:ribosomal protein S18 acetylase RimI-like enzyme